MQALQILVETCCDGDADQQRRALALFLRRVAEIQPPKRRPQLLLGPSAPETAQEAQAWARQQAKAAPSAGEMPDAPDEAENIQVALKAAPKVVKMPDDQLLDSLIKDGGLLKHYQQGTRSFTLPQRWKGQALPTYMETWKEAFRRFRINAPDPAVQVVGGKMVLSLSFGDMPGQASPSMPVGK